MPECRHILGFDEGYGTPSGEDAIEYEAPRLVYFGDPVEPSVMFLYCPLCRARLFWLKGRVIGVKP